MSAVWAAAARGSLFFILAVSRYFTWDPQKFAHPIEMLNNLTAMGRKLVAISDPHIKKNYNYFVDNDCTKNGYYVKKADGSPYEGESS